MSRERVRLSYTPAWNDVLPWAIKFIHQNKWRCDRIYEFDDLLNEAYLIFEKIKDCYPRVVQKSNFFGLFKTALRNYIHDHSRIMRDKNQAIEDTDADVSDFYAVGEWSNTGELNAIIAQVPELKQAYIALQRNPKSLHRTFVGVRENLNEKLRRVTGIKYDFIGGFKEALTRR